MKEITKDQLLEMLSEARGAKIVSFTAITEPDMRMTLGEERNPYIDGKGKSKVVKIRKVAHVNGMINFKYDQGVLRRLEKEGKESSEFQPGTSWHTPLIVDGKETCLSVNKKDSSKHYLRFMLRGAISSHYVDLDNNILPTSNVENWLSDRSSYSNQGLDDPLIFLCYNVDSIQKIKMGGEEYKVKS